MLKPIIKRVIEQTQKIQNIRMYIDVNFYLSKTNQ